MVTQGTTIIIREYAPLCLAFNSGWGRVSKVGRGLPPHSQCGDFEIVSSQHAPAVASNFGRMQNASNVGRVVGLFRYPVKSMAAESLDTIEVDWNGFAGDRRWAFVRGGHERSGFPWLTIREHSVMWHYKPRFVEPDNPDKSMTVVRTPGGKEFDVVDPALAEELGHGARVIKQGRGIFDAMPLSLITTQTIAALSSSVGLELEARRSRRSADRSNGRRRRAGKFVGRTGASYR